MSNLYRARVAHRTDDGMTSAITTHERVVYVEAPDVGAARLEAIAETYRQVHVCSRVSVVSIQLDWQYLDND